MNIKFNEKREFKINFSVALITIGFALIVLFYYWQGMFLGKSFPFNTFLPGPVTRFGDLYSSLDQWSRLKFNGIGYGLSYFPSTYLLIDALSSIGDPYIAAALYQFLVCTFIAVYIFNNTKTSASNLISMQRVLVFSLMCYPFLITFHTANLEAVIFCFLALFLTYFQRGQFLKCAIPLGLAISMKMIPGIFLLLLLKKRQYKAILLTFTVIFTASTLPLLVFDGGFNTGIVDYIHRLQASQKMYFDLMVFGGAGNAFGHSILNTLRICFPSLPAMEVIAPKYAVIAMGLICAMSYYILRTKDVLWKQVTLIVCALCLLPYTSTDYKLLHFLLPIFLYFNCINTLQTSKFNTLYLTLFTLILIPKNYLYLRGDPFMNINNIINTLCMLFLVATIIIEDKLIRKYTH